MEYDGDATIGTSDDLADYAPFTSINGSLLVESSDCDNINLPSLEKITGDLIITFNEFLTELSGLDKLKEIGGRLTIKDNDSLSSEVATELRSQVEGAAGIKGAVDISGNKVEEVVDQDLEGDISISQDGDDHVYKHIKTLKGKLVLEGLTLHHVSFPELTKIEGDLVVCDTGLKTLDGLENLESVSGEVCIMSNTYLMDVDITALVSVEADLVIRDNGELETLDGLKNVRSVGGNLEIAFNPYLPQIKADEFNAILKKNGGLKGETTMTGNTGIVL